MSKNDNLSEVEKYVEIVNKKTKGCQLVLLSKGFERQPCMDFGLPSVDVTLNGGLVCGSMVELFGGEGSGKTTVALTIMGNALKKNPARKMLIVDAEHKLDRILAKNLGVDLSIVPFCQPESAEKAFATMEDYIPGMSPGDIVLVDSVACLTPKAQLDGGVDKESYGGNSQVISRGINCIRSKVGESGAIVIFVNQIRDKLGVFYGQNTTTPGGHGLKHACETRIEVSRGQIIKDGDRAKGQIVRMKVVKSAHSSPFNSVELELEFGVGFNKVKSLLEVAISQGVITQGGAWFAYGDEKIQGMDKLAEFINSNNKYDEVLSKLKI